MNIIKAIFLVACGVWILYRLLASKKGNEYNRDTSNYDRGTDNYNRGEEKKNKRSIFSFFQIRNKRTESGVRKQSFFSRLFSVPLPFDDSAITWCANFLIIEKDSLIQILRDMSACYSIFKLGKKSGGYRIISAPNSTLLNIQKTIYTRALLPVNLHPASMGFRQNISVVNNAQPHLGKGEMLKVDIADFFGSIKRARVVKAFEKIGYPTNISKVLAELCVFEGKLPQGAPSSPALSNIIAYDMDVKLAAISQKLNLTYTRYADDLTFSGEKIDFDAVLSEIDEVVRAEKFVLQKKKTRFLTEKKRKIVTGISISSGKNMTIPKAKKREIRKNVHHILTKGLASHQHFIGSADPSYLKRTIGYLNFWLMVEPDNEYVKRSIESLKRRSFTL